MFRPYKLSMYLESFSRSALIVKREQTVDLERFLPAAGQVSLLLLLLDEGVCAIILEDDRLAHVRDLTALVQLRAQQRQLVLRGRLQRLDFLGHPWLERHLGEDLVDGDEPDYYPRFGFGPTVGTGLACEFDVPAEVFMVAELTPGSLSALSGTARYMPQFNDV